MDKLTERSAALQSLFPSANGGLLELCRAGAMRRLAHFLLAVELDKPNLQRFDLLLHKLMDKELDGPLKTTYIASTSYASANAHDLAEIIGNELLPDVINELTMRLADGRRSIEVRFSRKAVESSVVGGAFDESWEAAAQRAVSAFLREQKAKFLGALFAPVCYILCGAFYMIYAMACDLHGLTFRTWLFYTTYIVTSFFSSILFWLHSRGILFPHAKIALRDPAASGNKVSLIAVLSLVIQIIRFIADYFLSGARLAGTLLRRRPAFRVAAWQRAAD